MKKNKTKDTDETLVQVYCRVRDKDGWYNTKHEDAAEQLN